MKRLSSFCRALCLSLALTACASDGDPAMDPGVMDPPGGDPEPGAVERVDANLDRLRALEVFQVGDLVVAEGKTEDDAAAVLEDFASRAEQACTVTQVDASLCSDEEIAANLAALRELQIVEVGDLLAIEPANNPSCYNLPCAEDVEAAEAETCARANKLANIVTAATSQY